MKHARDLVPDGEMLFLAADPKREGQGIGTELLRELERREPGREIYLYTDSGCTWQFYEHRGFERREQEEIVMELGGKSVPLTCFLYRKRLPGRWREAKSSRRDRERIKKGEEGN